MIKIAVYGKGGIGKSTTVSNVAAALAEKGLAVMQIGCDPKADSTIQLRHGREMHTVLDLYNEKKQDLKLEDMTTTGYQGVICVEAGLTRQKSVFYFTSCKAKVDDELCASGELSFAVMEG